jgi:hypothetical protein
LIKWSKARKRLYLISNKRAFTIEIGNTTIVESYFTKDLGTIKKTVRSIGSGNLILSREHHTDSDEDKKPIAMNPPDKAN